MKKIVLFDNYNIHYDYWYSDYEHYCQGNDIECASKDSDEFHTWLGNSLNEEWYDFNLTIKLSEENCECIVLGSVGRWNGTFEIIPKKFNTLLEAIHACVSECEYITITLDNGVINVVARHHDGVNNFVIKRLNKHSRNINDISKLIKEYYHTKYHSINF